MAEHERGARLADRMQVHARGAVRGVELEGDRGSAPVTSRMSTPDCGHSSQRISSQRTSLDDLLGSGLRLVQRDLEVAIGDRHGRDGRGARRASPALALDDEPRVEPGELVGALLVGRRVVEADDDGGVAPA